MMGRYQAQAHIGVKRVANFRRRWADKSDTAIKAVLNHFWRRQTDRSAAAIQKEKDTLRH
ncbi:hypothetical protein ACVIGB_002877 [Bradyrhizobium sp. USDA 4341]